MKEIMTVLCFFVSIISSVLYFEEVVDRLISKLQIRNTERVLFAFLITGWTLVFALTLK